MILYNRKYYGVNRLRMWWEFHKIIVVILVFLIPLGIFLLADHVQWQASFRSPDGFMRAAIGIGDDDVMALQSCPLSSDGCSNLLSEIAGERQFHQIHCWREEGIILDATVDGQRGKYLYDAKTPLKSTDLNCS